MHSTSTIGLRGVRTPNRPDSPPVASAKRGQSAVARRVSARLSWPVGVSEQACSSVVRARAKCALRDEQTLRKDLAFEPAAPTLADSPIRRLVWTVFLGIAQSSGKGLGEQDGRSSTRPAPPLDTARPARIRAGGPGDNLSPAKRVATRKPAVTRSAVTAIPRGMSPPHTYFL